MGEAKRRGTFEHRKADAIEKRKIRDFIRNSRVVVAPVGSKRIRVTTAMLAALAHAGVLGSGR